MDDPGPNFEVDFEQFRSQLGPLSVSSAVRQMIVLLWGMVLPRERRNMEGIREASAGVFQETLGWWASVHDLAPEAMGQRLSENLEVTAEKVNFGDMAELSLRQGFFCCWLLLPQPRRTPVEVARLVAGMLQRGLNEVEEDYRMFGAG